MKHDMKTANAIIEKALSFVGVKENPAGSNNVIFNTDYYGHPVSGGAYPWCVTYGWDIFRMCGASDLFYNGQKTASCITVRKWARDEKLTVDKAAGRMGDIVLFDWNGNDIPDHFGFIVAKNANGSYETVEGNTSKTSNDNGGSVMRRTRYLNEICEVIRPKYEEEPMEKRYNHVEEMPSYYQPEIQQLINSGALKGDSNGNLNLSEDMIRCLLISKRYAESINK